MAVDLLYREVDPYGRTDCGYSRRQAGNLEKILLVVVVNI
jgi:hypothetical protein